MDEKNIKALYDVLKSGKRLVLKSDVKCAFKLYASGEHKYFNIFSNISADDGYIYYNHYGSSAVKNNFNNFRFVIKNIFKNNDFIVVE